MKLAKQSNIWNFPVHQEQLLTRGGISTNIHAVIRGDTGECVGHYKGQKLVPNREVVDIFENQLQKMGVSFDPTYLTTGKGGRFFARYRLSGIMVGKSLGDSLMGKFTLQNSYDGSLKIGFESGLDRLACLNGMRTMKSLYSLFKRHSESLDLSYVSGQIEAAMASFDNLEKEFAKLADVKVNYEQGRTILANLTKLDKYPLSTKMAERIDSNWVAPTSDEKVLGDTLYRLYNAGTRSFRDLETNRFELSNRTNGAFTEQLLLASENRNVLNQLLVPAKLGNN